MSAASAPRVLFCTDGVFPHAVGGIQRHSRLLAEELARRGRVELAVVHPHERGTFPESLGIEEIPVAAPPGKRHYFLELHDYSKRVLDVALSRPDHVVYSQGMAIWSDAQRIGERLVVHPHGLEFYQALGLGARLRAIPYRIAHRRIFRAAARVASLGGRLTDMLKRRVPNPDERVVVLPNATNPVPDACAMVRRSLGDVVRCLFVGRLASNKGVPDLVAAARSLERSHPGRFRFTVAGGGPLLEGLRGGDLPDSVALAGFVSDEELDRHFAEHDVFVLPTLFEGMPTVILEAMARGLPIVVTDVGATRELVSHDNGFIIPKRSPSGIADALVRFAELAPAQLESLSRASLERMRTRFTWQAVAERYEDVFFAVAREQELLRGSSP